MFGKKAQIRLVRTVCSIQGEVSESEKSRFDHITPSVVQPEPEKGRVVLSDAAGYTHTFSGHLSTRVRLEVEVDGETSLFTGGKDFTTEEDFTAGEGQFGYFTQGNLPEPEIGIPSIVLANLFSKISGKVAIETVSEVDWSKAKVVPDQGRSG